MEKKVIQEFCCSGFIFCADSGLGFVNNLRFNSFDHRAYVITHSLKKMKKEEREVALKPFWFRKKGFYSFIDLRTFDETDEEVYNTVYYREFPVVTGDMDETLIVTTKNKFKTNDNLVRFHKGDDNLMQMIYQNIAAYFEDDCADEST